MKCDSDPMGCTICQVYGKECKVTDLTTGQTTTRGEIHRVKEDLERSRQQIRLMGNRICDLLAEIERYKERIRETGCPKDAQVCQQFHFPPPLNMTLGIEDHAPGRRLLRGYDCNDPRAPPAPPAPPVYPSFLYPSPALGVCLNQLQVLPHRNPTPLLDLPRPNAVPPPLSAIPVPPVSLSRRLPDHRQQLSEFEQLWAMRTPAPDLCGGSEEPGMILPDSVAPDGYIPCP